MLNLESCSFDFLCFFASIQFIVINEYRIRIAVFIIISLLLRSRCGYRAINSFRRVRRGSVDGLRGPTAIVGACLPVAQKLRSTVENRQVSHEETAAAIQVVFEEEEMREESRRKKDSRYKLEEKFEFELFHGVAPSRRKGEGDNTGDVHQIRENELESFNRDGSHRVVELFLLADP